MPWLLTLARNRALDTLRLKSERQRRLENQTDELFSVVVAPQYEKELDEKRRAERVRSLVDELNPQQKRAIELAYFEGLSHSAKLRRNFERTARYRKKLDKKWFASLERGIAGDNVKNCDQFREMYEASALGALDPADRAALEAHLATGCPDCAKAVEEARWLVSQLAYTAPEAAPSDMLKGRLMQTVRSEAKSSKAPRVCDCPDKSAIPFWLWAAVAGLLVFSIYSAWNTRRLENEIREANDRTAALRAERQKAEEQLADAKREATILMDPTSVKIMLSGGAKIQAPKRWKPNGMPSSACALPATRFPCPAPITSLQLWFIPRRQTASPCPRP